MMSWLMRTCGGGGLCADLKWIMYGWHEAGDLSTRGYYQVFRVIPVFFRGITFAFRGIITDNRGIIGDINIIKIIKLL
jgi:hypothetical protein